MAKETISADEMPQTGAKLNFESTSSLLGII